jgi:glycosyltransferase involved in cell wall biosynthesis
MISDHDKFMYLKNAKLLVFPSLYEGFGIPLLEAFSLHTPLAVSRIPVFEEIFGLPEAMFDPRDPSDIARVIETICNDPLLRNAIIAHGKKRLSQFSWKKTAQETLSIYNSLINL